MSSWQNELTVGIVAIADRIVKYKQINCGLDLIKNITNRLQDVYFTCFNFFSVACKYLSNIFVIILHTIKIATGTVLTK